jgi:hypothetical protein
MQENKDFEEDVVKHAFMAFARHMKLGRNFNPLWDVSDDEMMIISNYCRCERYGPGEKVSANFGGYLVHGKLNSRYSSGSVSGGSFVYNLHNFILPTFNTLEVIDHATVILFEEPFFFLNSNVEPPKIDVKTAHLGKRVEHIEKYHENQLIGGKNLHTTCKDEESKEFAYAGKESLKSTQHAIEGVQKIKEQITKPKMRESYMENIRRLDNL